MILKMYSIFDVVVGAHMQPFFARSEGEAVRLTKQAVNDEKSTFAANPGDYHLCYHGDFHDDTGLLENSDRRMLVNLLSLTDTPKDPLKTMFENSTQQ